MTDNQIVELNPTEIISVVEDDTDLDQDYKYLRTSYKQVIDIGQDALLDALNLARNTDSARAYEVVGGLIKSIGDVGDKLINLQEKMKKIETNNFDNTPSHINTTTNNAVFVGSTDELFRKLLEQADK